MSNGDINIDTDKNITFKTSEKIDEISVKKAITIFPLNLTDFSIKLKSNAIIISPKPKWKKNQFYTIIIDRNLSDLQNNKIHKPISVSFSTGNNIPNGSIKGKIYNLGTKDNCMIIFSSIANSVDSLLNRYEYYSQANNNGEFYFNYLPSKRFTILGFVDNDNNKKYHPKFDDLILPNKLFVDIDDSTTINLEFNIVRGNFLPPQLIQIENIYQNSTELTFSKSISQSNVKKSFKINDIPIDTFTIDNDKVKLTHHFIESDSAIVSINNLKDKFNRYLPDTSSGFLINDFTDSIYTILYKNKELSTVPIIDSTVIEGYLITENDTTFQILTKKYLGVYEFNEKLKNKSITGKFIFKAPKSKNYPFLNSDSTNSVKINQIVNTDSGRVFGKITYSQKLVLILSNDNISIQICPKKNGNFLFDNLPSGKYYLYYYVDTNGNNRIDNGNIYPFTPPEIKKLLLDNIQVRANWDTDIGKIEINI